MNLIEQSYYDATNRRRKQMGLPQMRRPDEQPCYSCGSGKRWDDECAGCKAQRRTETLQDRGD